MLVTTPKTPILIFFFSGFSFLIIESNIDSRLVSVKELKLLELMIKV